jgi:hypothetical protein
MLHDDHESTGSGKIRWWSGEALETKRKLKMEG